MTNNKTDLKSNRVIVSEYGGGSIAICFEGDTEFIERGFNGLCNYGGMNVSKFFNFRYCSGTMAKLRDAFAAEGRAIKMYELLKTFSVTKGNMLSITKNEEDSFVLAAKNYGEKFAVESLSNIEKRNVAKYLLKNESILGGIYFTLPNGDVYLGEPYSAQEQLPRLNFADRDWYKGVSKTNETYISAVFLSASTRAPATAIALPVYQDDNNIKLMGYWVGIVNIGPLWKTIKDDYLPGGKELNVIDHEGTEMFNSGKCNYTEIQSAPSFYENGNVTMIDKDSATIRILEGDIVAISYPIHIRSHVWTVTTIG